MTSEAKNILKVSELSELSCEECSKDIPFSAESEDYVAHFCGLACYTEWKDKHRINKKAEKVFVYKSMLMNK